ncbi:MAG TPA: hypothetical protein VFJ90_00280 [Candidatus Didemnitutus sp.]|nr:hypothetical protein [Candidatus Didemnitutus sp.]
MKTETVRPLLVGFLLASSLVLFSGQATSSPAIPSAANDLPTGRYLLVQGQLQVPTNATNAPEDVRHRQAIFRIDTKTGKTWMLQAGFDAKGNAYPQWVEITLDPLSSGH